MLARNPSRMDYQQKYEEIIADYNREKDRVTIEETFRRLTALIEELDAEQKRAVEEGLTEDELALFDLLKKDDLGKAARERVRNRPRRTSRSSYSTKSTPTCRHRRLLLKRKRRWRRSRASTRLVDTGSDRGLGRIGRVP